MIYRLLSDFKDYLLATYSSATAKTYHVRLCSLFVGHSVTNVVENLDIQKVLYRLEQIKYRNHFSQAKNSFLRFCEFQKINLSDDILEKVRQIEKGTRKKYRKLKAINYAQVKKKIKHIKNKKLKLSFQVIVATGLRISELAGISPKDCVVSDDEIVLNVLAKGRKYESVTIQKNEYPLLYREIKEYIDTTQSDKKIFYSAVYLQSNAKKLGFKCHDLRRAYAKLEYKKCRSKNEVMKKLRHSSLKNTNIYLNSKIKV